MFNRAKPLDATAEDLRHAYRLLLGREPDSQGLAHFQKVIRNESLSAPDLTKYFLGSEEFQSGNSLVGRMVEMQMDGYSQFVDTDDRDVSAVILQGEPYEPYVESVLRELLSPGSTFVDVGANIGCFTALAAHLVGPQGRVLAWEPLDKNVQLIYATVWKNRFRNVVVYPFAASFDIGLVAMTSGPFSSNAGIAPREFGGQRTRVIAQTQRLDDQLGGIDHIDLIKFDIEGHELYAWQGASSLLAKHRPHVLTEFHPKCIRENTDRDPSEYLALLLEYSGHVEVLHRKRARVVCTDIESILREWQRANDDFAMHGAMHIDLYVNPSRN